MLKSYLKLLRLRHWIKNTFLFIPAFFAASFDNVDTIIQLVLSFIAFSFCASSVYIFNDYLDREADRKHPIKSKRPIASGAISAKRAFMLIPVLLLLSLGIAFNIDRHFFIILCVYGLINLSYSLWLKHISILDVMLVSSGFLLRIVAGGIIADVPISQWLVIMVFLLSLFLAFGKRRDDLLIYNESKMVMRKSIEEYNLGFINTVLGILSAIIIVSYIMYTVTPEITGRLHNKFVYTTTIYVIAGIFRYLQILLVDEKGGSPTDILYKDKFIIGTLVGFMIHFYIILY